MNSLRCSVVLAIARLFKVPIDVHPTFFAKGKKDLRTPKAVTSPK